MCVATTYACYRRVESSVDHRRLTIHYGGIADPPRRFHDKGTPGESRGRKAEGPRRAQVRGAKPAGLPKTRGRGYATLDPSWSAHAQVRVAHDIRNGSTDDVGVSGRCRS